MTVTIPLRTQALHRWVGEAVRIEPGPRQPLAGGVVSPLVERIEVTVERDNGCIERLDVVAKRASDAERIALQEIQSVVGATAFPQLIDAGTDAAGAWVVMPFYVGSRLPGDAELPNSIYDSLARLHLHYQSRVIELPAELPRVDGAFCRSALLDFSLSGIRRAQNREPHSVHERALELLPRWADDERMAAGPRLLPATLVHGDAYGGNVIVGDRGAPPRLIDWGSARIGPAMLDLVLSAPETSPGYTAYRNAYEQLAGRALDPWLSAVGHAWATAFSVGMFVGSIADRFGPDVAEGMLNGGSAALDKLGKLLDQRAGTAR